MMISEKMAARLNEQVKHEFYSSWLYMAMGYALESMALKVFAEWFFLQAAEERVHAEKIASYLLNQDAKVVLESLAKPPSEFGSVKEIVEMAVEHELTVTKQIHEIADLAAKENDRATLQFMGWFVDEQVEEVASTKELAEMVKHAETHGQLLMLEGRVYRLVEARK